MTASRNRSVVIVTVGAVLQMAVQFLLQLVLARQFGAGRVMDAYGAAAIIPLVIAGMVGVPLGAVLIPSLSKAQAEEGEPAAMGLAGQCGLLFAAATLLIGGLVAWQSAPLTALFFHELPTNDQQLAIRLLMILAWLIPASTLTMFCQSFQNWQGRFAMPAVAGVVGPLVTVVIVVMLAPAQGIHAVAWGVVVGAVVNVLVQAPGMRGIRWGAPSAVQLRGLVGLMGPLLLASVYMRIEPLVDRSLAANLGVGVIAHLSYSSRMINAVLALTSGALSVVAFPYLSIAATKSRNDLAAEASQTLVMLTFVLMPFVAAFLVFAPEIIRDLFQRGEFVAADTTAVANLIRWSLGIVVGASIGEITSRAFYADHCMWPPVVIGIATLTLAIAAKFALVSTWGAVALVGLSSAAYCLSAGMQFILLRRRLGPPVVAGIPQAVLTSGGCAAAACLAGGLVSRLSLPYPALLGGLIGGVVYAATAVLVPGQISTRVLATLRARFQRD